MSESDPIMRSCYLASAITLRTAADQLRAVWYSEAYALEPPIEELLAEWRAKADEFTAAADRLEKAWIP